VLPGIPQHVTGAEAVAARPAPFRERLGRLTLAVLDDSG
jgi:hypothetical protein